MLSFMSLWYIQATFFLCFISVRASPAFLDRNPRQVCHSSCRGELLLASATSLFFSKGEQHPCNTRLPWRAACSRVQKAISMQCLDEAVGWTPSTAWVRLWRAACFQKDALTGPLGPNKAQGKGHFITFSLPPQSGGGRRLQLLCWSKSL